MKPILALLNAEIMRVGGDSYIDGRELMRVCAAVERMVKALEAIASDCDPNSRIGLEARAALAACRGES